MVSNIVVICQHGASTGMLVEKMLEAAKKKKIKIVINAYSEAKLVDVIDDADIVLIAPQVRYKKTELETKYANKGIPFMMIEMMDYGMLNGEKVLNEALEKLEQKRR